MMDNNVLDSSKVLMDVNPAAKDTKLIVNKNIRTLEDLRKNFSPAQSSVLSEVRNFLPKLATANQDLQKRLQADPEYSADIERLEDSDSPHIEMNLALVEADFNSEDSSLDSDTSSDNDEDIMFGEVNENNFKLPKQGVNVTPNKQLIHMLDDKHSSNADSSLKHKNHSPEKHS